MTADLSAPKGVFSRAVDPAQRDLDLAALGGTPNGRSRSADSKSALCVQERALAGDSQRAPLAQRGQPRGAQFVAERSRRTTGEYAVVP